MPPLARSEIHAVIDALTKLYVDGNNDGHWHIYTFTLQDGSSIRGRIVAQEDDHIIVGLDEDGHPQTSVPCHQINILQIEAE